MKRVLAVGRIEREYDIDTMQDVTRVTVRAGGFFAGGVVRDSSDLSVGDVLTDAFTALDQTLREQKAGTP